MNYIDLTTARDPITARACYKAAEAMEMGKERDQALIAAAGMIPELLRQLAEAREDAQVRLDYLVTIRDLVKAKMSHAETKQCCGECMHWKLTEGCCDDRPW